ncbi:hypothetical protein AQZ52_07430 [Novosphingobium fuchskuhlense]|uniref:SET domain-containing protein n=1 Tax=Novosphingobium fuchskuhlense TaxID=1117702 RepID=A0A117UY58_9SPHN|nr:SET domain-containing protein-lysine N-methyltransferase [Novosphingobium fuchskuhlense]KUR73018.1 hypothetical protein AQZ52_07430 [Novosphingobium fuchskuhlense]
MEIRVAGDARIDVLRNDDGYSRALVAVAIGKDEVLAQFGARETLATPNYLTVQTGPETHILLAPEHLQYINHSCEPNVFFDTTRMEIIALRDIAAGEECTFFYPSTEWTMDRAFDCLCGSSACLGRIAGADMLDADALERYAFNQHILDRLAERLAEAA